MSFSIEDHAGTKVVYLHGEMVGANPALVEAVTNLLTAPGVRVVISMADVPFMNSTGLADLVRLTAQANVQEGQVILTDLSPFVAGVLQTTQLIRFFETAATVDEALSSRP